MAKRPTKPEGEFEQKDPMQELIAVLQKNNVTMNNLLKGLNGMTKAEVNKTQKQKTAEEIAIDREKLLILQEKRRQAELDTKEREKRNQKASREDYKENILYRVGADIAGQNSSALSSMALSVLTGGAINPVIAKTFGIDKVFSAGVNMVGRGIGRASNAAARGIKNTLFGGSSDEEEEEEDTSKGKTKKRDSSAISLDTDKSGRIEKTIQGIKANTDKMLGQKTDESNEKEEKSGIMDKLFTGAKIASAIAGLAGGVYAGIKYFDQIKNTLTKIGEFLSPIVNGIAAIAKATWDAVTSIAEDATNAVLSVKEGWDSVMNFFSDLGTAVGSEWAQFKELGLLGYLKAKFSGESSTPKAYKTKTLAENQLKNMERAQTEGVDLNNIPLDQMTTAQRRVYLQNQANDENGGGYGTFNKTMSSKDDVVIHNRQAKSLESLGLAGSIASTNSIPYIAESNTDSLKKLDNAIDNWGYDIIYTSAMGGHKPGTGHWKGNKVDLQLKKGGKPAHLSYAQLQALRKAGYWGSGTGALGWEPVSGQVGGGHYDLFLGNGGGTIGGGEIQYAQNNTGGLGTATGNVGKMESQKVETAEESMSNTMADVNENIVQGNSMKQADNSSFGGISGSSTSSPAGFSGGNIGTSGYDMPQFAGITGGSSGGQQSKAGTVYAYGDVAKTAILHTI